MTSQVRPSRAPPIYRSDGFTPRLPAFPLHRDRSCVLYLNTRIEYAVVPLLQSLHVTKYLATTLLLTMIEKKTTLISIPNCVLVARHVPFGSSPRVLLFLGGMLSLAFDLIRFLFRGVHPTDTVHRARGTNAVHGCPCRLYRLDDNGMVPWVLSILVHEPLVHAQLTINAGLNKHGTLAFFQLRLWPSVSIADRETFLFAAIRSAFDD